MEGEFTNKAGKGPEMSNTHNCYRSTPADQP